MARAGRRPKSREELASMPLPDLNVELREVKLRESLAGASVARRQYSKERALIESVREKVYGIKASAA